VGFLIVFGLLLVLTLGAFLFAWRKLKVGAPKPDMAIDEAKKIRETVTVKASEKPAATPPATPATPAVTAQASTTPATPAPAPVTPAATPVTPAPTAEEPAVTAQGGEKS
jgi:predicted lipid-binding transport protein (Tim44 family)